ncbi:ABC transporter permease [Metabacillus halosaccharovorans]|uniref:ABC transporter permease n=1 Tax=Metabacillus halosaccharovorans TaxID=930124 RepID=UPI001C1F2A32|nr:ABC transporter permease [Metabacillus halosaccharovorans]MBU7592541.1 ABC transporter permease subunit [Metabacillus halosaccharovorans]
MQSKLIYTEWLKLKKSKALQILFISPILSTIAAYFNFFENAGNEWMNSFLSMIMVQAILFLPLLAGIFAAAVCRYEHAEGGWKQLLALPINRLQVYSAKLITVCTFVALTQILMLAGLFLVGMLHGFNDPFPWKEVLLRLFMGWLGCLPIISLQLWVSTAWSSFAAPVALNVILTLPNILIANSETFGPWYPWAQPFLGMVMDQQSGFTFSIETLVFVIIGGFLIFTIGGMVYFKQKAV